MNYRGFVGGSYELDSPIADCTRTINLIPELIESGTGKSPGRLRRRPGLAPFVDFSGYTPAGPIREMIQVYGADSENVFVLVPNVMGTYSLWQIDQYGNFWPIVSYFTHEARSMATNGREVVIAAKQDDGASLYCLDVPTFTLNYITTLPSARIEQVVWHPNGYFIGLDIDNKKIYISGLMSGASWAPADSAQVFVTDSPVQMIVDHKELWIFGEKSTTVYYDSGNPDMPLEPVPGASIQTGILGRTVEALDNTLFWLGQTTRGGYVVWRANGYTPVRVSNNSIEERIKRANPEAGDIVTFAIDWKGHALYLVSVTGLDVTFAYDAATGLWHEWATGPLDGSQPIIANQHCFAWGKHLLASSTAAKIYTLEDDAFDDDGSDIAWKRRAPHLAAEGARNVFYHRLTLDIETGMAGYPDSTVSLRSSDDGGRTWNTPMSAGLGAAGDTFRRVTFGPLGSSRNRVFEVYGSAPVPITIVNADLDVTPGRT